MNIINVKVNFTRGTCEVSGINLITGDYNSTKMVFTFDRDDGTKIFEMKSPSEELVMVQEIQNNEIVLYGLDDNKQVASLFKEDGSYIFEISLYENGSKLTSASGKIKVKPEQVVIDDEVVEAYIPVFDQLLNDITTTVQGLEDDVDDKLDEVDAKLGDVDTKLLEVDNKLDDVDDKIAEVDGKIDTIEGQIKTAEEIVDQANNLDLDISKSGKTTTVTITKKDETTESENILDGKNLEFVWSGTSLGVRVEGDSEYTYVNLQGVQGPVGPQGEPFKIKKTYSSISEMNADFNNMNIGDYVMIANSVETEDNAKLYTKTITQWVFITDFSGATGIQGPTGPAPSISIGTVTSGSTSSVTRTGTDENPVFNFVLEKGDKGDTGATGATGNGIASITKISSVDTTDTYRITYTDGTHFDYEITNGEVTQEQLDEVIAENDYLNSIIDQIVPKTTGTGTSITLDNTIKAKMTMDLAPSELTQAGTPTPSSPQDIHTISGDNTIKVNGKNLFDGSSFQNVTNNGITLTKNSINEVVLNGTSTAQANFNSDYFEIKDIEKVVLSGGSSNVTFAISTYTSDKTYISASRDSGSGATYTIPSNASYYIVNIRVPNSGTTLTNYVLKAQIEKNVNTTTPYEPYQEQTAQLNLGDLEYSAIGNYKDVFMKPSGSNLFDGEIELGGIDPTNGLLVTDNTRTRSVHFMKVNPNTTYTITRQNGRNRWIVGYDINKNGVTDGTINPTYKSGLINIPQGTLTGTFTTTPTTEYIKWYDNQDTDLTEKVMINEGTTALPYEPYNNGKWYLKKKVLNTIVNLTGSVGTLNTGDKYIAFTPPNKLSIYGNDCLCTKASYGGSSEGDGHFYQNAKNFVFIGNSTDTKETLKAKYDGSLLYYIGANDEYILLNDTLQEQLEYIYNQMLAYKGQTNISQINSDLPFDMVATALKDLSSL